MTNVATKTKWKSRAVIRLIEPGSVTECLHCDEWVKFKARERRTQVICNVYVDDNWERVEHFHSQCYGDANSPYGDPGESVLPRS